MFEASAFESISKRGCRPHSASAGELRARNKEKEEAKELKKFADLFGTSQGIAGELS